jgi:hypothetical protein
MPSLLQLQAEPWWNREIITPELDWLGDELCRRTGAPPYSIGTKGDENHLNGGHRSQEWIVNSDWCTNIHYTVQNGLAGDQPRHIAALDRTPLAWGTAANRAQMVVETQRLLDAARAGRLPGITQIQGTLDGKTTYGQNFPSLITTVPSDSHLDHWHLTFDRRYLHDAMLMQRIVNVVLGTTKGLKMYVLVKKTDDDKVYLADGMTRRWIETPQDLADIKYLASTGQIAPLYKGGEIQVVGNLGVYGLELGKGDGSASGGLDETTTRLIVREELDKTRLATAPAEI